MAAYVVMEPPVGTAADQAPVFVRDGFHWLAFLVPPLWLALHRAWIAAILAVLASVLFGVAAERSGLGPAGALLSLLVSLYVGLEAPALRLAALRRRNWIEAGVVEADSHADAELRYLVDHGDGQRGPAPTASVSRTPDTPAALTARPLAAFGMVPYPGRTL